MSRRIGVGRATWGGVLVAVLLCLLLAEVGASRAHGLRRGAEIATERCFHPGATRQELRALERNPQDAANESAAIKAAERLLAKYVPPSGSRSVAESPAGECGQRGPDDEGVATMVTGHHFWSVPGTPSAVLAAIEAHPPVGSRPQITGSSCGPAGCTEYVVYSVPGKAGAVSQRSLSFAVKEGSGGFTELEVYAAAVWLVAKPSADLIPPSARVLEVTVSRPYPQETLLSTTVTEVAKVVAIVAAINKMPVAQPGIIHCPEIPSDGTVATFTFLEAIHGPVVATAKMPAYTRTESSGCYPLTLTLPTLAKPVELGSGEIVGLAERILGLPIDTAGSAH